MGRFITAKSRIEQVDVPGYWKTIDNELYLANDNNLYLAPRYLWSDGYTFPGIVMLFLGDKQKFDVRAAHGHDLCCRFHQAIKVDLSLTVLKQKELLRIHNDKVVLEDIPLEYLEVITVSKTWTDNLLKEMMIACNIPRKDVNIIRAGVFFNLNWWLKTGKKDILDYDIYNEDIGLVNGV